MFQGGWIPPSWLCHWSPGPSNLGDMPGTCACPNPDGTEEKVFWHAIPLRGKRVVRMLVCVCVCVERERERERERENTHLKTNF